MADTTTQATEGTNEQQTAAAAQSGERTFTQEEVNRMVGDARVKERKKYEGYVDGKDAAEAAERAQKAEAELARLKAEAQRATDVSAAAEKAGIPLEVAQMLNGTDADELLEQAKKLLKLMPVHPARIDDGGASGATAKKTNAERFASFFDAAIGNN
jgi:hypothetical protein